MSMQIDNNLNSNNIQGLNNKLVSN